MGSSPFADVDQRRDQDQRESEDHPVLERDAQKRDLLHEPVVHRALYGQ